MNQDIPITVLFFGSQGAGKGTQVKMLIEYLKNNSKHDIIHIDMGHLLREMVAANTYSSQLVHEVIGIGGRMPDFMPIYLATQKLVEKLTGSEHIIADGLARGADQTRGWEDAMQFYKRDNFQIINLVISDDVAVTRLLARGRNDDTEEGIRNRLAWTKTDVLPQLEFLKNAGRTIHTIDGERDIDVIHQDILLALGIGA
ncbi:MAG: adk, adenylate kinase, adenylate kinase [Candidatus Kaiserbacteria bacterium]|nr:adk, adenylate kinase, adenylate kinase [Candidatus Kaiserbacteria bacterium]